MRLMKNPFIGLGKFVCAIFIAGSVFQSAALAQEFSIVGGWPCNVWMDHAGDEGAVGNYADFEVKSSPTAATWSSGYIYGAVSDYLTSLGKTFNTLIGNLPLLKPLSFNLQSDNFGGKLGVDVCIPVVNATRDEPVTWTVNVSSVSALIAPVEGDWFQATTPKVDMQILASNCNSSPGTNMSTTNPLLTDKCVITSRPATGTELFTASGQQLNYNFKNLATREMALRFSFQEQSTALRPHRLDAGKINIELFDDPLPPLLVGDLLGKQLFYAPESDLVNWPGCANFNTTTDYGIAFSAMNLQGPNSNLDLRWTGNDNDCTKQQGCADGNKGGNNFSFPVIVYLEDGTVAAPNTSPTAKVGRFIGLFDDFVFSGETKLPSDGKIEFLTGVDKVYRDGGKAFFSTTVSRFVGPPDGPGVWRSCRVWFKRDNGFSCASLPTPELQYLCNNML
ncbi:MAG: hypothetical protein ACO3A4_14215 [Silvanigrellaceae bacterium]